MLTNEFEKQVQKQLEDLQLNPSASVWQKVEEEIRKKKRRRVLVFLLLPLAIGLLGFSVYLFVYNPSGTSLTRQAAPANNQSLTKEKNNAPADIKEQSPGSQLQPPPAAEKTTGQEQKLPVADKNNDLHISTTEASLSGTKPAKNISGKKRPANTQKKQDLSPVTNTDIVNRPGIDITIENPPTGTDKKNVVAKNTDPEVKIQNNEEIVKDIATAGADSLKKEEPVLADNKDDKKEKDPVVNNNNGEKRKITWGVEFSGGMTSNSDETFAFAQSYRTADNLYNTPSAIAGANPPYALNTASPVKAGPAFRIGLVAELRVSKKIRLSTGLRYAFASNRIKTGTPMDTSVSIRQLNNGSVTDITVEQVYAGVQTKHHTNTFHFIQLPVGFHWQLNKGKRLPVQWDAGFSVGYLVGSNVLVYDPAYGGVYFRNKKALNKTHVNASTGFSFRIRGRNQKEWTIGPELSFDMSKVINRGYDEIQYLLYGGINARLLFPKKKGK